MPERLPLQFAVTMFCFALAALLATLLLDLTGLGGNWVVGWTMAATGVVMGLLALVWYALAARRGE